ncbi:hypothetical protein L288_09020 [Sphingobium quisquiliarum P25]|uniref:DUF4440 domain-containing protein n=1 Tax=Sphingobium quisquiliarum P25 TaxID=1329909 RepID=T0IEG9_9SPHN|nr:MULTISPECIES: nuclear transport factor 2 family protein [Sphingobium]EQB08059.1 hypothetical protein L288_09020 [Sphingobium quisquiliarum P25]EZP71141.1 hypothetical protein BV96_02979 [Sphingomonas paucimobilis]
MSTAYELEADGLDDGALAAMLAGLEARRREALTTDDMAAFEELIADDIVHVHTTGIVHDKAQLLQHAGGFLQFIDIRRGPLKVRRIGPGAAIMTGEMTNIVRRRGHEERIEVGSFVTQVWVKRNGKWQIASFHAVRTSENAS